MAIEKENLKDDKPESAVDESILFKINKRKEESQALEKLLKNLESTGETTKIKK